jgi:hypothetical protein
MTTMADPSDDSSDRGTGGKLLLYFSDVFEVEPADLESYGAFNVSLINDLPLFIDPFLLFNSKKPEYQDLHRDIIRYVRLLRDKSASGSVSPGLLQAWYFFKEVRQNWLGFSKIGNSGSGLARTFAESLNQNLGSVFANFGEETITKGSHLEKLTLIRGGVGKDNISDFTTNLIKRYLLEYTQSFATRWIRPEYRSICAVQKVSFNYETESWEVGSFDLPIFERDFVLLTPKDMLTKDETWINRDDLISRFDGIASALPDAELRELVNNRLRRQLPRKPKEEEIREAKGNTLLAFPAIVEYYIKAKEDDGDKAESVSDAKVRLTETTFVEGLRSGLVNKLFEATPFYETLGNTKEEARKRVLFLKDVIENQDGYRVFWPNGQAIRSEADLHLLYRLTWCGTVSDVNREVNNGRGPVDFKISRGAHDKSLVEFKLASNSQLKRNLQNQVAVYLSANNTDRALKVITYFTVADLHKVEAILQELEMSDCEDIILIDARKDNKPSGSKA